MHIETVDLAISFRRAGVPCMSLSVDKIVISIALLCNTVSCCKVILQDIVVALLCCVNSLVSIISFCTVQISVATVSLLK